MNLLQVLLTKSGSGSPQRMVANANNSDGSRVTGITVLADSQPKQFFLS